MKRYTAIAVLIIMLISLMGCEVDYRISETGFKEKEWELIEKSGRQATVNLYVYEDHPDLINWLNTEVKEDVKSLYGIQLNVIRASLKEITAQLKSDQINEKTDGSIDLIYLSQSTDFEALKAAELLYGPFLGSIKAYALHGNHQSIESQRIEGKLHEGYAVPVWKESIYLIGNEDFLLDMPESYAAWIKAIEDNPNTFTFAPDGPLGGKLLRGLLLNQVGYDAIVKASSQSELKTVLTPAFEALNTLKKQFYLKGASYPVTDEEVDQLFRDSKLLFSMSSQFNHIVEQLKTESYPEGAKPIVIEGILPYTPKFMVIPAGSGDKSGALLTLHTLLSAPLQASLLGQKGPSLTPVIDLDRLSQEEASLMTKATVKKTIPKGIDLITQGVSDLPTSKHQAILTLWKAYMAEHP